MPYIIVSECVHQKLFRRFFHNMEWFLYKTINNRTIIYIYYPYTIVPSNFRRCSKYISLCYMVQFYKKLFLQTNKYDMNSYLYIFFMLYIYHYNYIYFCMMLCYVCLPLFHVYIMRFWMHMCMKNRTDGQPCYMQHLMGISR